MSLDERTPSPQILAMRSQRSSMCRILSLERRCSDNVIKLRSALEGPRNRAPSGPDMWDRTVSFFFVRKTPLFYNGYSKSSREALRLFPKAAEDVAPLCCQHEGPQGTVGTVLPHSFNI